MSLTGSMPIIYLIEFIAPNKASSWLKQCIFNVFCKQGCSLPKSLINIVLGDSQWMMIPSYIISSPFLFVLVYMFRLYVPFIHYSSVYAPLPEQSQQSCVAEAFQ